VEKDSKKDTDSKSKKYQRAACCHNFGLSRLNGSGGKSLRGRGEKKGIIGLTGERKGVEGSSAEGESKPLKNHTGWAAPIEGTASAYVGGIQVHERFEKWRRGTEVSNRLSVPGLGKKKERKVIERREDREGGKGLGVKGSGR